MVAKIVDPKNNVMKLLKNTLFIYFLFSLSNLGYSQNTKENEEIIVQFTDVDPIFPGGLSALSTFLSNNINYPDRALKKGIQGKCIVGFVVDKEGNITDVKVLQKVKKCKECDAEAMRVIKLMPQWTPGFVAGKPVKSRFQIPINFKLTN